ncbi:riboflavin biosynthesis protein PYRD, chloroplastic [Mercurialis annua]|uniref:riboflavin biosynthesis protein PYRD, chloroplastic n=1 Tax=Mercurialis annua TaxID=3986 RepID=UPI00215F28E3|nr:riboflavin biosynthesis protein PYRD, chloroplastic [Mercurialis annua]
MQLQKFTLSNHTLSPLYFSHSPHEHSIIPPYSNSVSRVKLNSGFCNLNKRVSKSLIHTKKHSSNLATVTTAVLLNDDSNENKDDRFYIRRCVELARKAIGCTSPNPMVGCVIVKDGKIVGEGFHPKAGQPHAEVFALRDAGDLAENATAYVSLEPCNHYGRTPPCTEALIKARVKKVVVGMVDPNPIVASRGLDRLRDAGIDVTVGVEEDLCKRLNEAFIHVMMTGKPFVTLRYSLSVNGHLLNELGDGVTERGGYYSKLLQEYDAVIVPTSTVGKLSVPLSQEPGANQPLCVITATASQIQLPSLAEAASKMIVFTDKEINVEPEIAQKGIEIVVLDQLSLNEILEHCKRQGLCSVLLDLRGSFGELDELLNDAAEQNLLKKIMVEILPVWDESSSQSSLLALKSIRKRLKVKNLEPRVAGQSIILEGYL